MLIEFSIIVIVNPWRMHRSETFTVDSVYVTQST